SGRTKVVDRCFDRCRVSVSQYAVDLTQTGNLRFHIPCGSRTDMAFDAFHLGMRGIAPGGMFRGHYGMAEFAAERRRFRKLETFERCYADDNGKDYRCNDKEDGKFQLERIVEVEYRKFLDFGDPFASEPCANQPRSQRDYKKSENYQAGEGKVDKYAQIRVFYAGKHLDGEKGNDQHCTQNGKNKTENADRVEQIG